MSKVRYYLGLICGIIVAVTLIILETSIWNTGLEIFIGLFGACVAELIWWNTFPIKILRECWRCGYNAYALVHNAFEKDFTIGSLFVVVLCCPYSMALFVIGVLLFFCFSLICFPFQIFTLHAKSY